MPSIVRERFSKLPEHVLGDIAGTGKPGARFADTMFTKVASDRRLLSSLRSAGLDGQVQRALSEERHDKAASTRWRGGSDIESPHNSVHVAVGAWPSLRPSPLRRQGRCVAVALYS